MIKDRKFFQFSKRIVVANTICVTLLCLLSVILCWNGNDLNALTGVVKVYIQYAMVVFVAYSGNSAVEKWITQRGPILSVGEVQSVSQDDETANG